MRFGYRYRRWIEMGVDDFHVSAERLDALDRIKQLTEALEEAIWLLESYTGRDTSDLQAVLNEEANK
jgi:1,4-alpha-glucan branching enzyme